MNLGQKWNEMSSSSDQDQDAWFDDDDKDKETNPSTKEPKTQEITTPNNTQSNHPQSTTSQAGNTFQKEQQKPQKEKVEQKKVHISDEELLQLYIQKKVDDTKAIKVVGCHNNQAREIIRNLKKARIKELNESSFLLFFESEENLIEFLKEKIEKRYKFYLQKFESRPRDKERKHNQQRRQEDRPRKVRAQRDQEKEHYKQRNERRPERRNEGEHRKPREQRQKERQKKTYQPKLHYQFQKENRIKIFSNSFDVQQLMTDINRRNIKKAYNKIYVKAPFHTFPKVSALCHQISKLNYFIDKELPVQAQKNSIHEIIMSQNAKNKTNLFYQRYHPTKKEENRRLLSDKIENYFKDFKKNNLSQIIKGFNEDQYIKGFRQASEAIQNNWKTWRIQAEDDYIETLLKLTTRIKKSTVYDIELKPAIRNGKALLTAELRPKPQKERRPKVDVSGVNQYLN